MQALKDLDFEVRDRLFLESVMDIEFQDTNVSEKAIFYKGIYFSEADAGLQKQKKLPKAIFFVFGVRRQRSAFTVYNSKKKVRDKFFQDREARKKILGP